MGRFFFLKDIRTRQQQDELMDDPGLEEKKHFQAFRALERINAISFSTRFFWPEIARLAKANPTRTVRVLDVATGGGDGPLRLSLLARKHQLNIQIDGCDISPRSLTAASSKAEHAGVVSNFFEHCIITRDLPERYDVVISSLFLHHLTNENAVLALRRMADASTHTLMVHDLRRSYWGLAMAYVVTRFLTRSPIVHYDAPRSVESAFTQREFNELAKIANLDPVSVKKCWPCRLVMKWQRP